MHSRLGNEEMGLSVYLWYDTLLGLEGERGNRGGPEHGTLYGKRGCRSCASCGRADSWGEFVGWSSGQHLSGNDANSRADA